jgi:hypothetical protein
LVLQIEHDRLLGIHSYKAAIDFGKRTPEEQKRLFDLGLSKCDGVNKISGHQIGRAFDILLFTEGGVYVPEWPKFMIERYHDRYWETMGGKNDIEWDENHFEG